MQNQTKKTKRKGFTIVELVIVIAIVAVLAAVLIPTFSSLIKKANDSAYLQDRTNQMIADLAEKVQKQDYLTWEDLEATIAEKLNSLGTSGGLSDAEIRDAIVNAVNEYNGKLQNQNTGLTAEQVQVIIEKALEGSLTTAQVKAIVDAALNNMGVVGADVQKIVNDAVSALQNSVGNVGITKEQMHEAINNAIKEALGSTVNENTLNNAIQAALNKFTTGTLTEQQIKDIIADALGNYVPSETTTPSTTPPVTPPEVENPDINNPTHTFIECNTCHGCKADNCDAVGHAKCPGHTSTGGEGETPECDHEKCLLCGGCKAGCGLGKACDCTVQYAASIVGTARIDLTVGQTKTLPSATLTANGTAVFFVTPEWSTGDSNVAIIENSRLKAIGEGNTTLTVTYTVPGVNTFTASIPVYVTAAPESTVAVTGIELKDSEGNALTSNSVITINEGEIVKLDATVLPEDASNKNVSWSSSDTEKVRVDGTGRVLGYSATADGEEVIISVTTADNNKVAQCKVKVVAKAENPDDSGSTEQPDPATPVAKSINLNEDALTLTKGGYATLTVEVLDQYGNKMENVDIWWSSNSNSVTINGNSVDNVYAAKGGTAIITASIPDAGISDTCEVTVNVPITGVKLDYSTAIIHPEMSLLLTPSFEPEDATNTEGIIFNWSVIEGNVATVENGRVNPTSEGYVVIAVSITVGNETFSDTCGIIIHEHIWCECNKCIKESCPLGEYCESFGIHDAIVHTECQKCHACITPGCSDYEGGCTCKAKTCEHTNCEAPVRDEKDHTVHNIKCIDCGAIITEKHLYRNYGDNKSVCKCGAEKGYVYKCTYIFTPEGCLCTHSFTKSELESLEKCLGGGNSSHPKGKHYVCPDKGCCMEEVDPCKHSNAQFLSYTYYRYNDGHLADCPDCNERIVMPHSSQSSCYCGWHTKHTPDSESYKYMNNEKHTWNCSKDGCLWEQIEDHTVGEYKSVDSETHKGTCSVCLGEITQKHNKVDGTCTVCGYVNECNHTEIEEVLGSRDIDTHFVKCKSCKSETAYVNHTLIYIDGIAGNGIAQCSGCGACIIDKGINAVNTLIDISSTGTYKDCNILYVKSMGNFSQSGQIVVNKNDVIIDLGGKQLSSQSSKNAIIVKDGVTGFTVKNGTLAGNANYKAVLFEGNADIILENVIVKAQSNTALPVIQVKGDRAKIVVIGNNVKFGNKTIDNDTNALSMLKNQYVHTTVEFEFEFK